MEGINVEISKNSNREIIRAYSSTDDKEIKRCISLDVIANYNECRACRKFEVSTDRFKTKRNPILRVISKKNEHDITLYCVGFWGWSRYTSGGWTLSNKLYTRKQLEWFNFKKVKEYK